MGAPVIVGLTPEFAKFVTSNNTDLFQNGWPKAQQDLFPNGLVFLDGPLHTSLKKIYAKAFSLDGLRPKVDTLESIILENIASWDQRGTFEGMSFVKKVCTVASYLNTCFTGTSLAL
jgi:(+)-abscisic acid 8'-hydroxylase